MPNFPYIEEDEDEQLYDIVRFRFKDHPELIKSGVTLEEVQEHCNRDDSHGDGWFDGYHVHIEEE